MNVSSSVHGDVTTGCNQPAVSRADKSFSRQMFHRPGCECCTGNNSSVVILDLYREESPAISNVWSPGLGALFDAIVYASYLQDLREYRTRQRNRKLGYINFQPPLLACLSDCIAINLWNIFWLFMGNKVHYHFHSWALVNGENTNYLQWLNMLSFLLRAAAAVSSMLKGVLHLAASLRSCLTSPECCHININWWKEEVQQNLSHSMTVFGARPLQWADRVCWVWPFAGRPLHSVWPWFIFMMVS